MSNTKRGTAHGDSTREIRAMALAALPCPPLPILTTKECEDESSTSESSSSSYHLGNSHDLIGHFMNIRCAVAQEGVDKKREQSQILANQRLMDRFDDWSSKDNEESGKKILVLPPVEVSYSYFCDFTREYVGALMDGTSARSSSVEEDENKKFIPDIRMAEVKSVCRGDPIHKAALMFARSQDKIFGTCGGDSPCVSDRTSYEDLINLSAMRIINSGPSGAMTP